MTCDNSRMNPYKNPLAKRALQSTFGEKKRIWGDSY